MSIKDDYTYIPDSANLCCHCDQPLGVGHWRNVNTGARLCNMRCVELYEADRNMDQAEMTREATNEAM